MLGLVVDCKRHTEAWVFIKTGGNKEYIHWITSIFHIMIFSEKNLKRKYVLIFVKSLFIFSIEKYISIHIDQNRFLLTIFKYLSDNTKFLIIQLKELNREAKAAKQAEGYQIGSRSGVSKN